MVAYLVAPMVESMAAQKVLHLAVLLAVQTAEKKVGQ